MALSDTEICNLALSRIGANRLTDLAADATVEAQQCRLHYAITRDGLLKSHAWNFAKAEVALTEDATAPLVNWERSFILPSDCLRILASDAEKREIVGQRLFTDETSASVVYVRRVTETGQFPTDFINVLVLRLAQALVMRLAQDKGLWQQLGQEAGLAEARARMVNAKEAEGEPPTTWNEARRINIGG